jgi:hypothetical protein
MNFEDLPAEALGHDAGDDHVRIDDELHEMSSLVVRPSATTSP